VGALGAGIGQLDEPVLRNFALDIEVPLLAVADVGAAFVGDKGQSGGPPEVE
jgi:hypothetical protein